LLVFSLSVDNSPLALEKLNRLSVLKLTALIVSPCTLIVLGVEYLRVVKLLGNDVGEVLVDFELPLVEEAGLGKILNELVDAVEAVLGLSDHVATEIAHLVGVPGEASWEGGFMATRGDQMNVLASLLQLEDWLAKLPLFQCNFVFFLHVLSERKLLLCDIFCKRISLFPFELKRLRSFIKKNSFNLI
jgi:hypothetical protein